MSKRRGSSDDGFFVALGFAFLVGLVCFYLGYDTGWDAGVRAAVKGEATVIEKPDGTTEAVKVVKKEAKQ